MSRQVEFRDNTRKILDALDKSKVRALERIGLAAERYAKKGTPVDTGRLRNSITYAIAGKQAHVSSYRAKKASSEHGSYEGTAEGKPNGAVYIGTNVEYAPYIEYGTSRGVPAYHMIQKAATEHSDTYRKIVEKELKNG